MLTTRRRLMEFIVKRWGDEAKTDAAAAEHFPTVPSDETLAARVNEFLGTHIDRGKHQRGLRCVRRAPSFDRPMCFTLANALTKRPLPSRWARFCRC